MFPDEEDDREIMDVPPSEPVGRAPVTFDIPIPTVEQVAGEIARQIVENVYDGRANLLQRARDAIEAAVDEAVNRRVVPQIETLLDKPMQPTDNFGNPVGSPVTLAGFVAARVDAWAGDVVDNDGKAGKSDHYNRDRYQPRLAYIVAQVVNRDLKAAVDSETRRLVEAVKVAGTKQIASQIAERISSLIIKTP